MGINKMLIEYYKPSTVYHPGEILAGRVVLFVDFHQTVRVLEVKISGKAKVQWVDNERYKDEEKGIQFRDVHYKGIEKYLWNKLYLINHTTTLCAGKQVYDFSMILPNSLPSSFKGQLGSIEYTVKAKVEIPNASDRKVKSAFTIVNQMNLNNFPELKKCMKRERDKTFGCFCCASGPLTVCCYLPKTGFVPGENIPLTIEVDNASNIEISNVFVYIKQNVTWTSQSPVKKEQFTSSGLLSINMGGVSSDSSRTFSEGIKVPENISFPHIPTSNIINITYDLHIEADPAGLHTDLDIYIPIQIGTVPFYDDGKHNIRTVANFEKTIGIPPYNPHNQNYPPIPSAPPLSAM